MKKNEYFERRRWLRTGKRKSDLHYLLINIASRYGLRFTIAIIILAWLTLRGGK